MSPKNTESNKPTRNFQPVQGDFFKFEKEGQILEGTLTLKETISINNNEIGKFTLTDDVGGMKSFLGGASIDAILENIPEGTYIRLTYKGKERTNSGREVKIFTIEKAV